MAVNLREAMLRMVALEKEGMLALNVVCDAVPRFYHVQEAFPYWTNRVGTILFDADSEDLDIYVYEITARLVIGHITSGYEGENDANIQLYLPHMIQYLNERELLQSGTYPEALDDLERVRVGGSTGLREFHHSGEGAAVQVGAEITLRCEVREIIEQAYL